MADWSRAFDDPIPLPRGRQLVTLKDAADYIMKLPKAEQNGPCHAVDRGVGDHVEFVSSIKQTRRREPAPSPVIVRMHPQL